MNDAIARATDDVGAAAYLDYEAVEAGLLPITYLNSNELLDGARLALEELGVGFLVRDWPTRLAATLGARSQDQIGRFLLAVNREHRSLMRNSARVPWRDGVDAIVKVLKTFGLGNLIDTRKPTKNGIDEFRGTLRKELDAFLHPAVSARERYDLENRLVVAALELCVQGTPIQREPTHIIRRKR
jgi:hypothetical protein